MKRLPRSKLLSPDIRQDPPTRAEILEWLQSEIDCVMNSYPERDGVIRDAAAGRELICLEAAVGIVRSSPWPDPKPPQKRKRQPRPDPVVGPPHSPGHRPASQFA